MAPTACTQQNFRRGRATAVIYGRCPAGARCNFLNGRPNILFRGGAPPLLLFFRFFFRYSKENKGVRRRALQMDGRTGDGSVFFRFVLFLSVDVRVRTPERAD